MDLDKFENQFLNKKFKKQEVLQTGIKEFPVLSCGSLVEIRTTSCMDSYNFLYRIIQSGLSSGAVLWVDSDHFMDFSKFNNDNLLVAQPNSPEEGLNILTEPLLKCLNIVVIDSVLNVLPLNGDNALIERKINQLRPILSNCIIIFVNPLYRKYDIFAKYMDIIFDVNRYTVKVIKNIKTLELFSFNHYQ